MDFHLEPHQSILVVGVRVQHFPEHIRNSRRVILRDSEDPDTYRRQTPEHVGIILFTKHVDHEQVRRLKSTAGSRQFVGPLKSGWIKRIIGDLITKFPRDEVVPHGNGKNGKYDSRLEDLIWGNIDFDAKDVEAETDRLMPVVRVNSLVRTREEVLACVRRVRRQSQPVYAAASPEPVLVPISQPSEPEQPSLHEPTVMKRLYPEFHANVASSFPGKSLELPVEPKMTADDAAEYLTQALGEMDDLGRAIRILLDELLRLRGLVSELKRG